MRADFAGVPIFAGLSEAALELLSKRIEEAQVPAGTLILREGEPGNRFFLIVSGSVKVCKAYGTREETLLAVLKPKDFFGEMCVLETLPRADTVVAAEATAYNSLPSVAFYHLYKEMADQHSILVLNIARDLSRRLRHMDEAFAARH